MDPLELASQQAQDLTKENIATYRNFDPVGNAMRGFQFGLGAVQSIHEDQRKQALASEQIDSMRTERATEEARLREAQQRMAFFDQTLGLQSKKAAVELQVMESQVRAADLQQELARKKGAIDEAKGWNDVASRHPWKDEQGRWHYMRPVPGGAPVDTITNEDNPLVQMYMAELAQAQAKPKLIEAQTESEKAQGEAFRARADLYGRQPSTSSGSGTQNYDKLFKNDAEITSSIEELQKVIDDPNASKEAKDRAKVEKGRWEKELELTRKAREGVLQSTQGLKPSGGSGVLGGTPTGTETGAPPISPRQRGVSLADQIISSNAGLTLGFTSLHLPELGISQEDLRNGLGSLIASLQKPNSGVEENRRSAAAITVSLLADLQDSDPEVRAAAVQALRNAMEHVK